MSSAFPPDYGEIENIANVHEELEDFPFDSVTIEDFSMRKIQDREELTELKLLHKEWFPVNYDDHYFQKVLDGKIEHFIIVLSWQGKEHIVGAALFKLKEAESEFYTKEFKHYFSNNLCVYIMTIGVIQELRRMRLGQFLISSIIERYQDEPDVRYICLDVVSYNQPAISFYFRNQFKQMKVKKEHYLIEDERYDSLYFVLHLNSQKPKGFSERLKETIVWMVHPLSSIIRKFRKSDNEEKIEPI